MDLIDLIRERFSYDPDTGVLSHKNCYRKSWNGKAAGSINRASGYVVVSINNKSYYAHRLIWAFVYGRWPEIDVDHKNRVRSDNRLSNLREATKAQNQQNRDTKLGQSGLLGAQYHKSTGKWISHCNRKYLGIFDTPEEAAAAYARAAATAYGEYARAS